MESKETQRGIASVSEQASNEVASEQAESQYPIRRNIPTALSRWLRRGIAIALFLACLETGGNIFYHDSYAASYQPAQCLILSTQVKYVQPSGSGQSSPYYEPDFTYQITTANGRTLDIWEGYTGPGTYQGEINSSAEAQAVLEKYQVGRTYPCWYSTFGIQPEAELVFQPFAWWEIALTSFGTLIGGFLCSMIILMLIFFASRIRRLRKKGVRTTGTVDEGQIEFETSSDPIEKIRVPYANTRYEPGSKISVIYDPQDPHHHFRIARSLRGQEIACWCFMILFWLPLTIFLLALLWAA